MSKKKRILILSCILLVCLIVFAHIVHRHWISPWMVEKIVISNYCTPTDELSPEETLEFIKLYNSAKYEGSSVGYDTTPYYNFTIYFHDGYRLRVSEWGEHNFYVSRLVGHIGINKSFVSSEELDVFMEEIVEKYCYAEQ